MDNAGLLIEAALALITGLAQGLINALPILIEALPQLINSFINYFVNNLPLMDKKSVVWRCVSRLENTRLFCDARTVTESQIEQIMVSAINQTLGQKNTFLVTLQENIEAVLSRENNQPLIDIESRLQELQQELLKLASSKADYEEVGAEIHRLHDEKQKLQLEGAGRDDIKKRISDMITFLMEQSTALTEYDEALVRRLIEKVKVFEDKFRVEFKSGVTVDIEEK